MTDLSRWPAPWQWLTMCVAGLAAGWLLGLAHLPAALMLGPMIVAAVMGINGATLVVPRPIQLGAQSMVGMLIAVNLDATALEAITSMWPVVGVFVMLTLTVACAVGLIAARWTRLDTEVTVWGFLPGMAGTMVALADERGIDARMVAFIQYQRLLMVIATMVGVGILLVGPAVPHHGAGHSPDAASTALVLMLACSGILVGRFLPMIPAGATLVPLAIGGALSVQGFNLAAPPMLMTAAFLVIGIQVGARFTPQMLRTGIRALPRLAGASVLLLMLCGVSGIMLSLISGADLMTACLATVPGSIESIALLAVNTGSDVSFVMTIQTVRLFAVVVLGPPIARGMLSLVARAR